MNKTWSPGKGSPTLRIRIHPKLHQRLYEEAAERGIRAPELVRGLILSYLDSSRANGGVAKREK